MRAGMVMIVLLLGLALVAGLIFMDWGAAVVASTESSPVPALTNTPPAPPPTVPPPPTVIPVGKVFAPVVYDLVSTPTATLAVQPTRTAPPPPPTVAPVGQVFAPVVYDLVTTPTVTMPTATLGVQPTRTPAPLPSPPP
jgi:hypothetical protein